MNPYEILERSQLRPRSRTEYRRAFDAWMEYAPDSTYWSPIAVEAWRDLLLSQGKPPATINTHLAAIRYLGRRIEALGLGPNFAKGAESIRGGEATQRVALTVDEATRLIETCDEWRPIDVRDHAIITFGFRTAVRVGGLSTLTWDRLKKDQATVEAKGGKLHVVSIDEACRASVGTWKAALRKMLGRTPDGYVFRSLRSCIDANKLVPGDSISRTGIWKMLRRRGDMARITRPVHPHLLRHTFVVWSLEAGVPLNKIMMQTGHRSLVTLSGYVSDPNLLSDPIGDYLPRIG